MKSLPHKILLVIVVYDIGSDHRQISESLVTQIATFSQKNSEMHKPVGVFVGAVVGKSVGDFDGSVVGLSVS